MAVTVVGLVTINEDQPLALAKYLELVEPVLERVGAKFVARYQIASQVVGPKPAETVIIVEYPDYAAVENVFSSPEYESAKPFRDLAFSTYSVSLIG
ncbi:MAG: DUF1330 domain-containing protein [Silicimonas sp.]|nr:DUF1330 domain-containing protein [Silicimonas sp.]